MQNGSEYPVAHATTLLQEALRSLQNDDKKSRRRSLAITKVEEALHWLEGESDVD